MSCSVPVMKTPNWVMVPLLLVAAGCGIDPAKINPHEVYTTSAEQSRPYLRFAVVGGTAGGPGEAVIADLRKETPLRGFSFAVLTGNYVASSSNGAWSRFDEQWKEVLKGKTLGSSKARISVVPLAGRGEYAGDSDLVGYGASFPGVGKNIGYNRTASWGNVDAKVDGEVWRLVWLDSRKGQMGSRWKEQEFWLKNLMEDGAYDQLVLFINEPLTTLGTQSKMNPGGGPQEILELVDDLSGVLALRAVFFGDTGTNELYLHNGAFGEAHVVAGTAGWKTESLDRSGTGDAAGLKDIGLEPMFDLAMQKQFDKYNEANGFSEVLVDKAKAQGSFEGFTGQYDAGAMPIVGWWHVEIDNHELRLIFRMQQPDGSFADVYSARNTEKDGWIGTPGAP